MKSVCLALGCSTGLLLGADSYTLGPESLERLPDVPRGRVETFQLGQSGIFPDTTRAGWVYLPAQLDPTRPAALMVFQDGHAYVRENGDFRAPVVLDNLIGRGELPPVVGVFLNPGHRGPGAPPDDGWGNRNNRSFEYDSLGDAYARFLIEEVLPFVTNRYGLRLSTDPRQRAICGMSSGGICAWTVAWERPDQFGKVLSQIGSFVNIRGGHVYPALIRKTERKPIRVFLQDGSNDLNNLHGNWPLANQEMASALAFAGYDFRFVFGDGAHNGKHGGAIFPDSVRWLFRPELDALPKPLTQDNLASDEALSKLLPDGGQPGDWTLVGEGYAFTDAACADAAGNFYFSDLPKGTIYRVGLDGSKPVAWLENGPRISGMKFGPDGRLYACVQGQGTNNTKRIVAITPETRALEVVATDVNPNDLVVSRAGWIYFTDTEAGAVVRVPIGARSMSRPPPVASGIRGPNGIGLAPDERSLVVSEYRGTNAWTFLVAEDGTLRGGERNLELRAPLNRPDSGGDGLAVDPQGRAWITSHLGIQVFDANGRLGGVISRPQDKGTVSCEFGGPGRSWLYVCSSDRVYRRRTMREARSAAVTLLDPPEKDFFAKRLDYDGIPIKAPAVVVDEALFAAYDRLSMMLTNLPTVRARLREAGAALHIIGRDQVTTDLPEWRQDKGKPLAEYNGLTRDQRTRGMGGLLTSCGEENLLRLEKDRYRGRDICVHEFAHNILSHGVPRAIREKVRAQHRHSLDRGLWVGSYAGSNYHEFFAELAMWYFGTHGDLAMEGAKPGNGREGLRAYDPEACQLLDDVFSGRLETAEVGTAFHRPERAAPRRKHRNAQPRSRYWPLRGGRPAVAQRATAQR